MIVRVKKSLLYFRQHFTLGLKYAIYFMAVAGVMGFLFGVFGGVWISPALVSIAYLGIFVVINFVFALLFAILNLFPALFKKGSARLNRYFAFSSAFFIVFMAFFTLIKITGVQIF